MLPKASSEILPPPESIDIFPAVVRSPPASRSSNTESFTLKQSTPPSHTFALSVKLPPAFNATVLPPMPSRLRCESNAKLPPVFTVILPTLDNWVILKSLDSLMTMSPLVLLVALRLTTLVSNPAIPVLAVKSTPPNVAVISMPARFKISVALLICTAVAEELVL